MGKIVCNHCKNSFRKSRTSKKEIARISGARKLDGKYYCKECNDLFFTELMYDTDIIKRAKAFGMEFPTSTFVRVLERFKLIKRVEEPE